MLTTDLQSGSVLSYGGWGTPSRVRTSSDPSDPQQHDVFVPSTNPPDNPPGATILLTPLTQALAVQ